MTRGLSFYEAHNICDGVPHGRRTLATMALTMAGTPAGRQARELLGHMKRADTPGSDSYRVDEAFVESLLLALDCNVYIREGGDTLCDTPAPNDEEAIPLLVAYHRFGGELLARVLDAGGAHVPGRTPPAMDFP